MTRIVSFHSFRRSTGKSLIVANIAALLAEQGRNVGVVDAAFHSPGMQHQFGLADTAIVRTLNDYIWGSCDIEQAAYDVTPSQLADAGGRIVLVPASMRPAAVARVLREGYDVRLPDDGLATLIEHFQLDALLIDTHAGINEETLVAAALADGIAIVMRPDRQDHLGSGVTIEIAQRLAIESVHLILNELPPQSDLAATAAHFAASFACPVAAALPHSDDLATAADPALFCIHFPDHLFTISLRQSLPLLLPAIGKTY
ncbi:MAG TPA: MinD/ParA family protein [Roseiflexaceae bacterium]|nr:MinD/ParA family protein [Roseiflexaceae bacterium]